MTAVDCLVDGPAPAVASAAAAAVDALAAVIENGLKDFDSDENSLLESIARTSIAYAWSRGIVMLQQGDSLLSGRPAPFSLFPSPISKECFSFSVELSPIFTQLVANMTLKPEWLYKILEPVAEKDAVFTKRLVQLAKSVYGDGELQRDINSDIRLIIIRSDYMIDHSETTDADNNGAAGAGGAAGGAAGGGAAGGASGNSIRVVDQLKQVELNTISISFGGLSEPLGQLHKMNMIRATGMDSDVFEDAVPSSNANTSVAQAICRAVDYYNGRFQMNDDETGLVIGSCVLFVVRSCEKNEIDQRQTEFAIAEGSNNCVHVVRRTFKQLAEAYNTPTGKFVKGLPPLHLQRRRVSNDNDDDDDDDLPSHEVIPMNEVGPGALFILADDGCHFLEVAVVYFRTGYDPDDYEHPDAWTMRHLLEMSHAVKCPNVLTHLSGVKKVQASWCTDESLAECLPSREDRDKLRKTFVDQVDPAEFQSASVRRVVDEAIKTPDNFILKPQREGGLHNIHGDDLKACLLSILEGKGLDDDREGSSYILMRKICPKVQDSLIIRRSDLDEGSPWLQSPKLMKVSAVSELGTFGIHLASGDEVILHEHAGQLLRTKDFHNAEGGVAAGAAFLDSLLLVEN